MKVEVELDDLKSLLFGSSAIKTIEQAIAAAKLDPFSPPVGEFARAHNTLAGVMNSATRAQADTVVKWDGELTAKEIKRLKTLGVFPVEIDGTYRIENEEFDSLLAKGCIRMGQVVHGAIWPGEPRADIKPMHMFAVVLTSRGKEKLDAAMSKEKAKKE